ncbi:MAG TPA: MBL fold metallo-hydrolase [Thermomicrobiales bacterium]
MNVTFLGTAAAEGVPQLWCRCDYCQLVRQRGGKNIRYRTATLINDDLLIDAGPDLSPAAARLGVDLAAVRALLVTHPHYDHLEPDSLRARGRYWGGTALPPLTVYAGRASLDLLGQGAEFDALQLAPRRIAPFQQFDIVTGGAAVADPRVPRAAAFPMTPVRRYEVWTLAAEHSLPEDEAMLFVIRQTAGPEVPEGAEGATLFYGTDTGPFPEATWTALDRLAAQGVRFGAAVVDATFGTGRDLKQPGAHLTIRQMTEHQQVLARRGLLADNAQRLAIHFSHYFTPPHDELTALLAPDGIIPAYDGLTITL